MRLSPHLRKYWEITPKENSAFVADMEDVIAVYELAYSEDYPVVCMDESCKQLIGDVVDPVVCAILHLGVGE